MTILIKGGHVINPATQMDEVADVLIEDQKIKKIGKELPEKEAERVINADGCYVMPGFIDMHVHFRDPGFEQKEDIYTGMQAAAHGGYTTVLTMPNTKPVADNPDIVNYVHNKAKSGNCIHVLQVGAVTKGQQGKELADIEGMVKAGSPAISEDGKSVMDAALYRDGMLEAARLGIPVLAHCEDIHMVRGGVMNADAKAKELGAAGCGIGRIYEETNPQRDPRKILPNAKCIIGFGFSVPKGLYKAMEAGTQVYTYTSIGVKYIDEEMAEIFLLKIGGMIEENA